MFSESFGLWPNILLDACDTRAAPSEDENELRARRYFEESPQMLYFVQQKRGNQPYLQFKVVLCATFWAIFPGLKPNSPKLLHKMQHSPFSCAKGAEKVAFFAGFVASCAWGVPGEGPR